MQDLLNSAAMPAAGFTHLLAGGGAARDWLDGALATWSEQVGRPAPQLAIAAGDLAELRDLRGAVRGWVTSQAADPASRPPAVDVALVKDGVVYGPVGDGAAAVSSLILIETLLASRSRTLGRLKTCLNPECGAAFYDLSRNGTRVWHNLRTCGNAMNPRASRARRREAAPSN